MAPLSGAEETGLTCSSWPLAFGGLCEGQFPVNHQGQGQLLMGELWWGLEDLASSCPVKVNASILSSRAIGLPESGI